MTRGEIKHLRIVERAPETSAERATEQLSFMFARDGHAMYFASVENATEGDFLEFLEVSEPDVVLDLRIVPRFDFGRLSRKSVFRIFEEMSIRYYDIPCRVGATDFNDVALNPMFLIEPLAEILRGRPDVRSLLILLDDGKALDISMAVLPPRLRPKPKGEWCVRRLGGR